MNALLWDNDGILVDTEPLYMKVTRDILAEVDVGLSLEQYREVSLKQGQSCFDLARSAGIDEVSIERLRRRRDEAYHARVLKGVDLMLGARETLRALHGRLPMAIVTSSHPENLHAMHRDHEIDIFFDTVVASGDYARSKPHPDPYLEAASRLGVNPRSCVAIEDTERGLQAAVAAGMECWVIPHALSEGSDFSSAHRILSNIREVEQWVDERLKNGSKPPTD